MTSYINEEESIQIALCDWIKLQYPKHYPYIIRIPNEGKRSYFANYLMKKGGLNAGASDLFIAVPIAPFHGLFLEIKKSNYKITKSNMKHHDSQMHFINKMHNNGYSAVMCSGLDECISCCTIYFGPRRFHDIIS